MPTLHSRRDWLRRGALTAGALGLSPLLLPELARARPPRAAALGYVGCAEPELDSQLDVAAADAPLLRLGSNENPYGPSVAARAAHAQAVADGCRYPRNGYVALQQAIAEREGVTPEQVLIGAGSTELLGLLALAHGRSGGDVVAPSPTFNFLLRYLEQLSARALRIDLDAEHRVDLAALARAITAQTRLVYLCNPNNPTGTYLPDGDVIEFAREAARRAPVAIDEAYLDFIPGYHGRVGGYRSAVELVRQGTDVMVIRTFSKAYGMAGLRVGYIVGPPGRIDALRQLALVPTINVGVGALAAARAALADTAFAAESVFKIATQRIELTAELTRLGIPYINSITNFVAIELPAAKQSFRTDLLARGVMVSDFAYRGRTWGRISVGTPDELAQFYPLLRSWWQA